MAPLPLRRPSAYRPVIFRMSSSGLPSPSASSIEARPPRDSPTRSSTTAEAAHDAADQIAETAAPRPRRGCLSGTALGHQPGDRHRDHRQHLLEQAGVQARAGGGVLRHRPAELPWSRSSPSTSLPRLTFVGAVPSRSWQDSSAQLTEQSAETFEPGGLCRSLFLKPAIAGSERLGAAPGLALRDASSRAIDCTPPT